MDNAVEINEIQELQFVENEKGELTDLKLTENEERKETDGEGNTNTTEGTESELDNAEVKKEMEEFLSKGKCSDSSETADAAKDEQSKNQSKDVKKKVVTGMYYDRALTVAGLPLTHTAQLKKMLLETFGIGSVKFKPRSRDEKNHYLFFAKEEYLEKADKMLNEKPFLSYKLKAKMMPGAELRKQMSDHKVTILPNTGLKRKAENQLVDESKAKRKKETESLTEDYYFYDLEYSEQVIYKNRYAKKIVENLANKLMHVMPQLEPLICNREKKKKNGFLCKLDKLHECPPAKRLFARCKFIIGEDEETGEPAVGFSAGGGKVSRNHKAKQYFLPNVIEAAEVFEKLVKFSKREPQKGVVGFWCKLIIRSSTKGKLMLAVNVQANEEQAQEELSYLKNLITEFYETGEGKDTNVTSVYSQVTFIGCSQKQGVGFLKALSWGEEYLEEKCRGLKLLLDPQTFFLFNSHAAEMICDTLVKILNPTKKMSVIEIGCCSGFIGMHLAKYVGEIFCIGTRPTPAEIVLKEKSSGCQYFPGAEENILRTLNISNAKACAVITARTPYANAAKTSLELRKLPAVKRVVVITEATRLNYSRTLTALMKPSDNEQLRNSFFPVRICPIDTMPNAKHFIMVVLLERIGMETLPKFETNEALMKKGMLLSPWKNMPPNRIGPNMGFPGRNVWNENRVFPVGNPNFVDFQQMRNIPALNEPQMPYGDILQRQAFMNNEILAEKYRRRVLEEREAEEYRQQLLEEKEREAEEYRQRLLEEKEQEAEEYRRRLIEEKQREAADYQRRLQEERAAEEYRQMQRLRELEEEEYRRRLLLEKRERELMALKTKPTIQDVLADSIKEATLSGLDSDAALKLKHVITEAIKGAGILNTEEKTVQQAAQDKMSDANYSRYAPERQNLPHSFATPRISEYDKAERRNLQFEDNTLGSRRGNEGKLFGSIKSVDAVDHSSRIPWERKDVSTKSLAGRDVPLTSKKSIDTEMVSKNKPVSLLSLKFPPNIEIKRSMSSMQQIRGHEAVAEDRWRGQADNMDKRRWSGGMNKGAGISDPWRPGLLNPRQADHSNVEPYPRDVLGMKFDEWRNIYANKDMIPENREAYGSKSSLHIGRETKRSLEIDYQRRPIEGSNSLMPSVYGHIYGRTNASQLDSFRKTY